MMRFSSGLIACAAIALSSSAMPRGSSNKQTNLYEKDAANASIFSFNYGPPSATSVDLLGLDTDKIAPATGLGPFVVSIPALLDGSAGKYAGLDVSPAWILAHSRVSDYPMEPDYFREELFRLRLDIGATNGEDAKDVSKQKLSGIAFGFSLPLLSANSPLQVRWNGSSLPYFYECTEATVPAIQRAQTAVQGDLAVLDPDARLAGDLLDSYEHGRASPADVQSLIGYLEARYGTPNGGMPNTSYQTRSEEVVLGRALAWSQADSADPLATPVRGMSELLVQIDGVTPKLDGPLPPKAEVLSELLHFLHAQPAKKPGIKSFQALLTDAGIVEKGESSLQTASVVLDGNVAKTIEDYRARFRADLHKIGGAADKAAQSRMKSAGIATLIAACAKGASALAAIEPDLSIGAGYRRQGDAGRFKNLSHAGSGYWLSWRYPLATTTEGDQKSSSAPPFDQINSGKISYLMLGGSARYDASMRFITGDTDVPVVDADKLDLWTGLEGYNGWGRLGLQIGYEKLKTTNRSLFKFDQHGFRWLTSAALKAGSTGFWLGATYGNASGTTTKLKDKTFLITVFFAPPAADALLGNAAAAKADDNSQ